MSRLFLHIGAHKTGSTSIQKALSEGAGWLDAAGFVYPRICWRHHAQHELAFAARGRGGEGALDAALAEVEGVLSREDRSVILSSEELFSAPAEGVRRLARLRESAEVTVVAFLRRQDSLIESMHGQRVRTPGNGYVERLTDMVGPQATLPAELDFLGCVSTWAEAFGEDAIRLRLYEEGESLASFLDAIGFPAEGRPAAAPRMNPSHPPEVVEAVRLAKLGGASAEVIRDMLRAERPRSGEAAKRHALPRRAAAALMTRVEADNAVLLARFGRPDNPYTAAAAREERKGPGGLDERALGGVIARMAERAGAPPIAHAARAGLGPLRARLAPVLRRLTRRG